MSPAWNHEIPKRSIVDVMLFVLGGSRRITQRPEVAIRERGEDVPSMDVDVRISPGREPRHIGVIHGVPLLPQ